ncbi:MAG: response regulator [Chloroflexi bacterium]|nr:response regulator [Chloroflexota bacterium]MCI0574729.1 response regulator [Chloroflexota bacterium]MCI0646300.1 response regulator [Chloroflexota bacterium]MCI0730302.1 response regulator [Chloroflexota bacterium]
MTTGAQSNTLVKDPAENRTTHLEASLLRVRLVLGLVTLVVYIIIFALFYPYVGPGIAAFSPAPVGIIGWLFGFRAGLLASLLFLPLHTLLLNLLGMHGLAVAVQGPGGVGHVALVLIGMGIGRMHDLSEQIRQELAERRQAEAALRESEARNRALVQAIPDLMFLQDKDGICLDYHARDPKLLIMSPEEFLGKDLRQVLPPELGEPFSVLFDKALATDQVQFLEYPLIIRGQSYFFEARIVSYQGNKVLTIVRDVTNRKQTEEALRRSQKTESLGVLAGGVAHDFNNLLVAMLGQTSLALAKLPPEHMAREHVVKAMKAAERAADLTRQLLAYSGRSQFQSQPVHLNALIEENLHLFTVAVPKHISLRSELAQALPAVEGDAGQMQQVVMNLILNASEAIGDRPGTVRVATGVREVTAGDGHLWRYTGQPLEPGRYVTLEVCDDGQGMSQETIARIFDPFFTTKSAGHGLGLAAALGIVRSHRGGLRVESQEGQGATFTLLFPASDLEPAAASPVETSPAGGAQRGLILVIDDEEPVREAVSDILELEGWQVLAAPDGPAGIALYQEKQEAVRLVLLDLSMPGMSGEEALREVRRLDPAVPVILSSGYSEAEVIGGLAGQEGVGFLQKPYQAARLLQEVTKRLG